MFEKTVFDAAAAHNAAASTVEKNLYAKYVMPLIPMGTDGGSAYDLPVGPYTADEAAMLKPLRDALFTLDNKTVFQKIVSENVVRKSFLQVPRNVNNRVVVWGFVSAAKDVVPFTTSTVECYENCRLDYQGTEFSDPYEAIFAIRFRGKPMLGSLYYIPYSAEFGGPYANEVKAIKQPFTGSGYIGAKNYVIPEYRIYGVQCVAVTEGEIYKIFPDGHEELFAVYEKTLRHFLEVRT